MSTEKKSLRVYISGPMTGYPDDNRPAFDFARDILLIAGYEVVSPADILRGETHPYEVYLREDIRELIDCDRVYTLDGWENSRGAKLEVSIAYALNITVLPFNILEESSRAD